MMPTRLQDGLSVSLLQWMRSADERETRTVIVRVVESESIEEVQRNLENAGLLEIEQLGVSSLRGRVDSGTLARVVRCLGVCSVTEDYRNENHLVS